MDFAGAAFNSLPDDASWTARENLMGRRKKADTPLVKMRGIITASEWDEANKVTGITLSTVDEQEFRIHQDNLGKQLLRLLQKEVEVSGEVGEDGRGSKTLMVRAYEVKESL